MVGELREGEIGVRHGAGEGATKNARLRQLKNDSNKRAREAEKKRRRTQRIYEKDTSLTEHLQEQLDSQKAKTAMLALEVEDKAEEVQGLEQSFAGLEALLDKESLAEYERLKENRACDRPQGGLLSTTTNNKEGPLTPQHALVGFTSTPTHPSALHTRARPYLPPRH